MYCASCRQERLGGQLCAACGESMESRSRETLELELAHIDFLLEELPHWDTASVPAGALRYLTQRYERQCRILRLVLEGQPAAARVMAPEPAPPVPAVEPAPPAPVMAAAPVEPPPAEAPSPAVPEEAFSYAAFRAEAAQDEARQDEEAQAAPEPLPLPPVATEPLFDVPVRRVRTARLVEEVSTWNTIWKPFLYESIGWFIGAFLIVAGSLYLAFESWAGLTSSSRALVVFGMTAGYSSAFSVCGALMCRRDTLASAGRILGLIGAAVAPFAGLALGPVGGLGMAGLSPLLLVPLLVGWSLASARLVRGPAEAFDTPSRRLLQGALVGTTLMMGLAPLFARVGAPAFWLQALPCAFFAVLARQPLDKPRAGPALAFVLGSTAYLTLLFGARLHLALGVEGLPPALGSYAPFLAFLLVTCLRFRTEESDAPADTLSVSVVALQVGCGVMASTGAPPAFFLTALTLVWTALGLSRGDARRLPWLYAVYAGAWFAYTSGDQLLPEGLRAALATFRDSWFDDASEMQLRAFSALPFLLAGAAGAAGLLSRAKPADADADDEARADILLRATAAAGGLIALTSHAGSSAPVALVCSLAVLALGVGVGWRFERPYLSLVGAGCALLLPFSLSGVWGNAGASVACGALALGFAALYPVSSPGARQGFHAAAGWLALVGFSLSLGAGARVPAVAGMALSGAAVLLVAWQRANPQLLALAACVAAAVVPKLASFLGPNWVPPAMALAACGLAVLSGRAERLRLLAVSGVAYALLGVVWGLGERGPWFGVTVALASAAVAQASRLLPKVRPLAVVLGGVALMPRLGGATLWPWMTPGLSMALFVLGSLGASVVAARRGRSPSVTTAGVTVLVLTPCLLLLAGRPLSTGLVVGGMLAALFTARALNPSVAVVAATLWLGLLAKHWLGEPWGLLLATVLSVLALLDSVPAFSRVFAGGRRYAHVATVCAMVVLGGVCVVGGGTTTAPWALLATLVLPWMWTRANREPLLATFSPLLALVVLHAASPRLDFTWQALPWLWLALVRAARQWLPVRRLLLGRGEDTDLERLSVGMQGALTLMGALLVTRGAEAVREAFPVIAALVLLPGAHPSVRVGLGTALVSFFPPLRAPALVLLLALGLLTHHVPLRVARFFRAAEDAWLRPVAVVGALVLAAVPVLTGPSPQDLVLLAGVLFLGAFLLSQAWMLTVSLLTLASASLGRTATHGFLEWRPGAALAFVGVAFGAALVSALCQRGGVQRALQQAAARLSPGLDTTWSEPLWVAGVLSLGVPVVRSLGIGDLGGLPLHVAALGVLTALVLMVARERWMTNVATALLGGVLVAAVPPEWAPAVLAGTGLLLCMAGTWLDNQDLEVGAALHHSGWVMSLVSVGGLRSLTHPAMPLCMLFALGSAWAVVYRRREREWVGWIASLVAEHALLLHVGAVNSTGRGAALILPLFGAGSALLASAALRFAGERMRRVMGHAFAVVAMGEVVLGLVLVSGSPHSVRGAVIACGALAVLCLALVRRGIREEDETSAFLAQATLASGYLAARLHAWGSGLGTEDSVVALVGGVLFSGLYVLARREGAGLPAFRRPALWGAFLFPMAGLLTAPWHQPMVAAALLVGHSAHFATLAVQPSQRGVGSLLSAAAFNAALLMLWLGAGADDPRFVIIPAALSMLVLLRVFRDSMAPETQVWLRGAVITCVYVSCSWRAVMFPDVQTTLSCVAVCVVGVVVGVALRIRSYVYLGTAFMVTCVVANLVRFGTRDRHVGAAFLTVLGLGVVAFMVLFTAKRAELLSRYERVREMLDTWEG